MAAPTREDAHLLIEVLQLGTAMGMKQAGNQIMSDDFDPETADSADDAVSTVLALGETIGTLVKHDLLSNELVQDFLWVDGLWSRVGPAALKSREKFSEPRLYENFEALAKR